MIDYLLPFSVMKCSGFKKKRNGGHCPLRGISGSLVIGVEQILLKTVTVSLYFSRVFLIPSITLFQSCLFVPYAV